MKHVKILFAAVSALFSVAAIAQDFNSPQYAKWGATAEERAQNIQNSNLLKESVENRDWDEAAKYLKILIDRVPEASENTFIRGTTIYKSKISRAKSIDERNRCVDSLVLMYDLRAKYFGDHLRQGTPYILDRKAREYVIYNPTDRAGIRKFFQDAIAAGGDKVNPETVELYFTNLCNDYKNTDEVTPDEVMDEYARLMPVFMNNPDAAEFKGLFDSAFLDSGAIRCDLLEKLFRGKLEVAPDDEALLLQAFTLMLPAGCDGDYFFTIAEKCYAIKPSSEIALVLARKFENCGEYNKAVKYLNEVLATESDNAEREKLLMRIGLIELVARNYTIAAMAMRQVCDLNPENGIAYFVLAQCHVASVGTSSYFAARAVIWAAYDAMAQAVSLLENESDYLTSAKHLLNTYRSRFPTSEECLFNGLNEGERYTVTCGTATGVVTTVRGVR